MSIRFKDISSQITGTQATFSVGPAFYNLTSTLIIWNDKPLTQAVDYNENSDKQHVTLVGNGVAIGQSSNLPQPGDKLVIYYDDPSYTPLSSNFDVGTLKSDYLFGIDLKDAIGRILQDSTLANKLSIGIARMQRELLDFSLTPQVIKSTYVNGQQDASGNWIVMPDTVAQAQANLFEDPYDYDVNDYINWGFLVVRRKPIISVERIRLIYPTGQEIIQYPPEWIKIYHKFGQIQIVPMAGSFNQYPLIGQGAMYLPLMSGFLTKSVPSLIHVDYTAGLSVLPDDLKDAVYKLGAIEVLKFAGQAKAPGVASVSTSADGLSESTTLTQSANSQLFGALIKQLEDDVKKFIVDFKENQKGIDFRVA